MLQPIHHHAESYFAEALRLSNGELEPAFLIARHHNESGLLHPVPTLTVVGKDAPKAYVRLEHARWCADCPFCKSAQHAPATDHRWFCAYCRNAGVQHQYIELVWPKDVDVARIEAVVGLRPDPMTRNWSRGETVAQLKRENKENGLPTG